MLTQYKTYNKGFTSVLAWSDDADLQVEVWVYGWSSHIVESSFDTAGQSWPCDIEGTGQGSATLIGDKTHTHLGWQYWY